MRNTDELPVVASDLTKRHVETKGKVSLILYAGGTFGSSYKQAEKTPRKFKNLEEFIEGCNLQAVFEREGLHQKEDGKFYFADGALLVFKDIQPPIDSTNATSEQERSGTIKDEIENAKGEFAEDKVDVVLIQGTDTGSDSAAFFDLIYGRDMCHGLCVVSSQLPSDDPNSDAQGQLSAGIKASRMFRQVTVTSKNGTIILPGVVEKFTDKNFPIYRGIDENSVLARNDGGKLLPTDKGREQIALQSRNRGGISELPTGKSELPILPEPRDYDSVVLLPFRPTYQGNQSGQAWMFTDFMHVTLQRPAGVIYDFVSQETPEGSKKTRVIKSAGATAAVVMLAGSNNFPEYAAGFLTAADYMLPIFGVSTVLGATTENAEGQKYAAAASLQAKKLGLNNYIELPANRIGPDQRAEVICAYAAKYAPPRTAEFLLLCHAFSRYAWIPEDEDYMGGLIHGNRQALKEFVNHLEIAKGAALAKGITIPSQSLEPVAD